MRKTLDFIYQALITTQIWVALCFSALVYFYHLILSVEDIYLLIISFFSVIATYNSAIFAYNTKQKWRIIFVLIGGLVSIIFAVCYLKFQSLLIFSLIGILSLLYALPYTQIKFREIPQMKLFLIAFAWSSTIVLIPNAQYDLWSWSVLFQLIGFFLFITAITIPFDIRDLACDKLKLMTLPQRIGINKAKQISYRSLGLSFLLFSEFKTFNITILSLILTFIIAAFLIHKTRPESNKWLVAFWVEGISVLPLFFHILLSKM